MTLRPPIVRLLFAVTITLSFGSMSANAAPHKSATTTWKPNRTLLRQLAPAVSNGLFSVQPPQGYTLTRTRRGLAYSDIWTGKKRGDKTSAAFFFMVAPMPTDRRIIASPKQALLSYLDDIRRHRTPWTQTPPEAGSVNGLPCFCSRWSGAGLKQTHKVHGFTYATIYGSSFVVLSAQDVEPHQAETLKLAETAARTLRYRSRRH